MTNTAQKMNTDPEKDQTQDQPDSASAGSEGDTAADTTKASTTVQEATEEEKTVETSSPSPPSENTDTADDHIAFVSGQHSDPYGRSQPEEDLTGEDRSGSTEEKAEHSGTDGDHTGGSGNVNEESNVEALLSYSFSPGQLSCPISSSVSVCVSVCIPICPA